MLEGQARHGVCDLDAVDELTNREGLVQRAVIALLHQSCTLAIRECAAHGHDPGPCQIFVSSNPATETTWIEVLHVHVDEHHVRPESFALHSSTERGGSGLHFVVGFIREDALQRGTDLGVAVTDQDTGRSGHEPIERDVVRLHELHEIGDWNASVLRSRDSISLDLSGIKPLADGSSCDVADLGDFTSGQYVFFKKIHG